MPIASNEIYGFAPLFGGIVPTIWKQLWFKFNLPTF